MLSLPSLSSSSSISRKKYDVFLSFRGEDTRKNFTDHLYAALKRSGIKTFRDDSKLEAGEEIAPELFKAIQESWCSVIVFSKTYAFSGWCLDELVEIVKQRNQRGHKIFPIFYDVDPSDLRKQKGKVGEAFVKYGNKDKTQRRRTALTEVANLKGWHLNNRHEAELIEDIVTKILAKIWKTYPIVVDGLIGINPRLEKLYLKIDIGKGGVRIIGICGMGGIGKTTLARVVFNQMSRHFEGTSFLADVRKESKKRGLVSLQKQLLSQILLDESFNLFEVYQGNAIIKNWLCCRKVLVVIDDADDRKHLECLVGSRDWFGSGSRIIITTRDEHLLESYGVDDVYEPTTLDDNEALDHFNLKAFKSDRVPENDFIELSKRVVDYAGGLPLALEVLGSDLCCRDATQWRSAIEKLKRDSHKDILDKLQISFDGLEETYKNIFLDIAFFFNGSNKDFVIKVLDGCGFFPNFGIDVLIKKSLVKVEYNQLRMHDLLEEMGRIIVLQKSPNEPGKRCRLWEEKDVDHVLMNNTATESIEGIHIKIKREQDVALLIDAFLKMKKLRLLKVLYDDYTEVYDDFYLPNSHDLKYLSNELRLLDWYGYPFRSLPSSFQPDNLVALLLPYSRIEQLWEGNILLNKLKEVDLRGSKYLIKTPNFSLAPNLESLILNNCTRIVEVHPSIGILRKLKLLDLGNCRYLRSLPIKIGMKSLEKLILSSCSSLERFPEIDGETKCLLELRLDGTDIEELPSSIRYLSGLKVLTLRDCKHLRSLPIKIIVMEALEDLILSGCSNLERFPEIDGEMKCLLKLRLDGTGIEELPSSIRYLSGLKVLTLKDCKNLRSLPTKIIGMEALEVLILSRCSNLERFSEIDGKMEHLPELHLDGTGIEELPSSIRYLSGLKILNLRDCKNLRSLPTKIIGMEALEVLILSGCSNLERFPEIDGETKCLLKLHLDGTGIEELPSSIRYLSGLKVLTLRDCKNLRSLPTKIIGMEALEVLILSGCSNLGRFPEIDGKMECLLELPLDGTGIEELPSSIGHLNGLNVLNLDGTGIKELPSSIRYLSGLKVLILRHCKNLRSLPTKIIGMEALEDLILSGCSNLERFPDIDAETKCLLKLNLDGTGIKELPSSIRYLNRLKVLTLKNCKNLRSLPTKIIGMEALGILILSGCSNLKRFSEIDCEMECLLELYLDGTGIEDLPSSIGHLSKLALLNLKDCSNLASLPSSINGLKCLKTLNISGCNKVETLPENLQQLEFLEELDLSGCKGSIALMLPLLSDLSSLTYLNLSDCNLVEGDIPSDICCLSSLTKLDLSGNNFISLPATLGRLPMLRELHLLDCRMLKSLPEFLTGIEQVNIDGCASPEVVVDPTTVYKKIFDVTIRGINCYKLAERNNALTFLKKHLKIHADSRGCFNLLVPGSEIPEWFTHQTDEENWVGRFELSCISIKIPLPPIIGNDSPWVGVAFCCVFDFAPDDNLWWFNIHLSFIDVRIVDLTGKDGRQRFKNDHLWLCYWTRNELYNSKLKGEHVCDEIFECRTENNRHIKVKKCGFRLVYEKDLEEMEEIEEHSNRPASAKRKRIYEAGASDSDSAEERPQPKLLKRILNFFMGRQN